VFDVHRRGQFNKQCHAGSVQASGIQFVEAFHFALDMINSDKSLLGGLRLKPIVLDSCKNPLYVKKQLKASLFPSSSTDKDAKSAAPSVAIVAGDDLLTINSASLLSSFKFPTVGALATANRLSDKSEFPYFVRTVSSDVGQISAIFAILKKFSWTYVKLVYSMSDDVGNHAAELFIKQASEPRRVRRHPACH
jgi:hypothetical protein